MGYIILAISGIIGALFTFYILSWLLAGRTRLMVIIYNLVGLASALSFMLAGDWLGAIASYIPYVAIQFIMFRISFGTFGLNFRKHKFNAKLKREPHIYSNYHNKRLLKLVTNIVLTALIVLIIVLLIIEARYDEPMYLFILISSVLVLAVYNVVGVIQPKNNKDVIIFILGKTSKKLYEQTLHQTKIKEKEVFIDENYFVTNIGEIYLKEPHLTTIFHIYCLPNDQAKYQLDQFHPSNHTWILDTYSNIVTYQKKRLFINMVDDAYKITKELILK